jgi:hypothetical protein
MMSKSRLELNNFLKNKIVGFWVFGVINMCFIVEKGLYKFMGCFVFYFLDEEIVEM